MPATPLLPSPLIHQISSVLAVDPAALATAVRTLEQAADSLVAATPILGAAWSDASAVLVRQRTGEALHACRSVALAAIDSCLDAIESYTRAMREAAVSYRQFDREAIPAVLSAVSRQR